MSDAYYVCLQCETEYDYERARLMSACPICRAPKITDNTNVQYAEQVAYARETYGDDIANAYVEYLGDYLGIHDDDMFDTRYDIDDIYAGTYKNLTEYAEQYADSIGIYHAIEHLADDFGVIARYVTFDAEQFADDIDCNGDIVGVQLPDHVETFHGDMCGDDCPYHAVTVAGGYAFFRNV